MRTLNIQKLELRDYRCFDEIDIDFDEHLTVLVASNGAGKTSLLDAIAVALGPYVGSFDEGIGRHFEPTDIRLLRARETDSNEMEYAAKGVRLRAKGWIPGSFKEDLDLPSEWQRSLAGATKTKTTIRDAKELIDYGKRMQAAVRTPGVDVTLPLLAYYGTGRLWKQKKLTPGKLTRTSRTIGYADCLDPASNYKSFVEWYRYWSTSALQAKLVATEANQPYQPKEFDGYIESVRRAVNTCLAPAGWKHVSYSLAREELMARHDVHGELPVELLSDGIRNMVGMVADIAFRATKLNPDLGASASCETPGIVLIDEVDMHLHPDWQQSVLQSLRAAFPKIQWIVTTHSPQVLSTVRRENIRVLGQDAAGKFVAVPPLAMTYGEPSGLVMQSVMHVDPEPPVRERPEIQRLTELVDQGLHDTDEAIRLLAELVSLLGEHHPQILRLQRSIRRRFALKT